MLSCRENDFSGRHKFTIVLKSLDGKLENRCLVGYSAGSALRFGCVIYLMWTNEVAAKGKVGPNRVAIRPHK